MCVAAMERDAFDPFAQKGDDQRSWNPKALGAVDWAAAKAKTGGWDASFDLYEQDSRGGSALNTTVDSSIFEFGADEGASNFSEVAPFADDFFAVEDQQRESPGSSVQVAIHEQLTSLQDDGVLAPICQIEGSVHVRLTVVANYMPGILTILPSYVDGLTLLSCLSPADTFPDSIIKQRAILLGNPRCN